MVWGAPAGNRAMVSERTGGTGLVTATGGQDSWQGIAMDPSWSSDGSRILFTTAEGFGIVQTATGEVRRHVMPMSLCADPCEFSWLPNEQEVAIARRDPAVARSADQPDIVQDIAIYSMTSGKLVRVVPVRGVPVGPSAWSRDDRLVLVRDESFGGVPTHIVEVATGRTVGTIAGKNVHFLPNGRILRLTNETAELYDAAGRLLETQTLPADFHGREVSIGQP